MGNPLVHFEFVADNPEALAEFYRKLFDWTIEKFEGGMEYWSVTTGSTPGGGIARRESPEQMQTIYFDVPSVDDYLQKARGLGAKVIVEKFEVGDMGWGALIADPDGNLLGLWELNPKWMEQQQSQ